MLNILIDDLTNSIKHRETGTEFETIICLVTHEELLSLNSWQFNWLEEKSNGQIHKLTTKIEPQLIQGLISLNKEKGFIFISIVENAPFNIGKNGLYLGVGGNLFAYACKLSFEAGCDGYVAFDSKTQLVAHYQATLGAQNISSQRMVINTLAATKLVNHYFKDFKL